MELQNNYKETQVFTKYDPRGPNFPGFWLGGQISRGGGDFL